MESTRVEIREGVEELTAEWDDLADRLGAEPWVRTLLDPERQIAHWTEFEVGGHFPAMEQPELLAGDLRAFLGRFR